MSATTRDTLLALLVGAVLFVPGLGSNDLWNPDEPRYAEVAREMRLSGDYLVPQFNGSIYTQKPPLLFWTMCLSFAALGRIDEVAVRAPLVISAILTLPLILAIGRRFQGRRAGWLSVAVFGTCLQIMMQARTAQIDMLLVLWVTLAMYCFVRGYLERRTGFYLLFYAAAGVATLAKGPVGLFPPLLSIVAFLIASSDRAELRRMRLPMGLGIWALVVAAWLVPAGLAAGREYLEPILLRQNLTRYANPWGHLRPWYYYIQMLPIVFLPWSFFLPSAGIYLWRHAKGWEERRSLRFALSWVVVTLIFFSVSPGKRTVYLLTMYPGMALLIGGAIDRIEKDDRAHRGWLLWPLGLLTFVAVLACVALPRLIAHRPELEVLGEGYGALAAVVIGAFALFTAAGFWFASQRRAIAATTALATGSAIVGLLIVFLLRPPFDAIKSARHLSSVLMELAEPSEPYGIYPRADAAFVFYTGRFAVELRTEEDIRAFARRPGRIWLLAERDDLQKLDPPLSLVEVARDLDAAQGHILLTSSPPVRPPAR